MSRLRFFFPVRLILLRCVPRILLHFLSTSHSSSLPQLVPSLQEKLTRLLCAESGYALYVMT